MTIRYEPQGVCSRLFEVDLDGDTIVDVRITGGCSGNLQGLSSLLRGMSVGEAVEKLGGIECGYRGTSCPDQIARALSQAMDEAKPA